MYPSDLFPSLQHSGVVYTAISEPFYLRPFGPFYLGIDCKSSPRQIYLYEVMFAPCFLHHSYKLSKYLLTEPLLYNVLKSMHLPAQKIIREEYEVTLQRFVEDTPRCRRAMVRLFQRHPAIADCTFIMTCSDTLLSAQELAEHPEWF